GQEFVDPDAFNGLLRLWSIVAASLSPANARSCSGATQLGVPMLDLARASRLSNCPTARALVDHLEIEIALISRRVQSDRARRKCAKAQGTPREEGTVNGNDCSAFPRN